MDKIIKLLEEIKKLDMDDDGDIILFHEYNWIEEVDEALRLAKGYKALIADLSEGIDPHYCEEVVRQVGLE